MNPPSPITLPTACSIQAILDSTAGKDLVSAIVASLIIALLPALVARKHYSSLAFFVVFVVVLVIISYGLKSAWTAIFTACGIPTPWLPSSLGVLASNTVQLSCWMDLEVWDVFGFRPLAVVCAFGGPFEDFAGPFEFDDAGMERFRQCGFRRRWSWRTACCKAEAVASGRRGRKSPRTVKRRAMQQGAPRSPG